MPVKYTILRIRESPTWWTSAWQNYRWTSVGVAMWEWERIWRIWCNQTAWHQDITTLSQHFVALAFGNVVMKEKNWYVYAAKRHSQNIKPAFLIKSTLPQIPGLIISWHLPSYYQEVSPSFLTIFSIHTLAAIGKLIKILIMKISAVIKKKNSGRVQ